MQCRKLSYYVATLGLVSSATWAADLTSLFAAKPVMTNITDRGMYDVERCVLTKDLPNMPFVYRQPDKSNEELIVWDGTGGGLGGVAAALRLDGVEHTKFTFWGREKFLRRILPCVGLSDPG